MSSQASALAMVFSQSLAMRRQRPSDAKVRSTTHLRGMTTGHDLKTVEEILSKHDLGRVQALEASTLANLAKRRAGTVAENGPVNGSSDPPTGAA